MLKFKNFVLKHAELFTILGLGIVFYFIFFHNLWAYALMDVDESRYVTMAKDMFNSKDFLTLYLNGQYFFEKPPLFFWFECLSFGLFGKINEFTARFPVALAGTLCAYLTYFIGRKIVSRTYGVVSSLMLATSLEFLILAKFAILDIGVAACVWFSLCFGMLTNFCEEKNKKYFWWLFYIFSGFAVMAKGIPGFIVPFGSMFIITVVNCFISSDKIDPSPQPSPQGEGEESSPHPTLSRRGMRLAPLKEIFKAQYFLVGFALFFLITLPWHIIMLKMHDPLFFDEYIIKHHIARFFGEDTLGRKQPFYFYFVTILWGFFPWIVSTLAVFGRKILKKDYNLDLTNTRKFLLYNGIIAVFILLFFSASDTKLITYILPIYPALACLGGYVWTNYIERGEYSRIINKTVYVVGGLLLLTSVAAVLTPLYLPKQLYSDIEACRMLCIFAPLLCGLASIIFAKRGKYIGVFFTYVIFIAWFSAIGTEKFFEVDYKFGQDDLMRFAEYSEEHGKHLTAYQFARKYSLIFYGGKPVEFGLSYDINDLKRELGENNTLVILQKKKITKEVEALNYKVIDKGRKYILVE